jgi:hypothetical protein
MDVLVPSFHLSKTKICKQPENAGQVAFVIACAQGRMSQ